MYVNVVDHQDTNPLARIISMLLSYQPNLVLRGLHIWFNFFFLKRGQKLCPNLFGSTVLAYMESEHHYNFVDACSVSKTKVHSSYKVVNLEYIIYFLIVHAHKLSKVL
jgi:hypothetical protein